jgi:hypothetical protein
MVAKTLLADKAFDADQRVIEPMLARGKSFVIPPKSNRKVQRATKTPTRHATSSRISSALEQRVETRRQLTLITLQTAHHGSTSPRFTSM